MAKHPQWLKGVVRDTDDLNPYLQSTPFVSLPAVSISLGSDFAVQI